MALTNMLQEPRREIIETIIGAIVAAVIVIPLTWADYRFAQWLHQVTAGYITPPSNGYPGFGSTACPVPLGMLVGVALGMVLVLALVVVHALGDSICNALANRGADPRPKRRYRILAR